MKITNRFKGLAAGIAITLYGTAMMWRGKFEYHNFYSMALYSPAVIAVGVLIFLLCFASRLLRGFDCSLDEKSIGKKLRAPGMTSSI